jgi:hypothetical protein
VIRYEIKVITKLPNSEQSYKGKVKTHNYINRQNQSTTGKIWKKPKLNSEMTWKIWKKCNLNGEKIWKMRKKNRLNCEMIWKIWKKSKLNS